MLKKSELPNIGKPLAGGFFAGTLNSDEGIVAIIISPKEHGTKTNAVWGKYSEEIAATSMHNGQSNTIEMAAANSELAKWALGLTINNFTDWYIPARDELETIYRNLKPTTDENYRGRHGENPSAVEFTMVMFGQPDQCCGDHGEIMIQKLILVWQRHVAGEANELQNNTTTQPMA